MKVYKAETHGINKIVVSITCTEDEIPLLPTTVDDGVKKCDGFTRFDTGSDAITPEGNVYLLFEDGWKQI